MNEIEKLRKRVDDLEKNYWMFEGYTKRVQDDTNRTLWFFRIWMFIINMGIILDFVKNLKS